MQRALVRNGIEQYARDRLTAHQSRWNGRLPNLYMTGNGSSALPMIDLLKAAGKMR